MTIKLKELKDFINSLPPELDNKDVYFYTNEEEERYHDFRFFVEDSDGDVNFQAESATRTKRRINWERKLIK